MIISVCRGRGEVNTAVTVRMRAETSTALPLQPLAGSWQDRVKAAKRAEKRAAKKAAKAASGGADLSALSKGLPAGWQALLDAASGDVYYGNLSTKVGVRLC